MLGLTPQELKILKKLRTPAKVQDFLDSLPINFEEKGETCMSPRRILREKKAHCMEGALFAALAFYLQGEKPLLLDLKTISGGDDYDHVVALFQKNGYWGAVSKTNHAVLRYRDPIYRTIRELALSYFHEYFMDNGKKTLRSYSRPFDVSRFDRHGWATSEEDLWYIANTLDDSPHVKIISKAMIKGLRPAHGLEIKAGKLIEWSKNGIK